jgi:hypothetical protein
MYIQCVVITDTPDSRRWENNKSCDPGGDPDVGGTLVRLDARLAGREHDRKAEDDNYQVDDDCDRITAHTEGVVHNNCRVARIHFLPTRTCARVGLLRCRVGAHQRSRWPDFGHRVPGSL